MRQIISESNLSIKNLPLFEEGVAQSEFQQDIFINAFLESRIILFDTTLKSYTHKKYLEFISRSNRVYEIINLEL